MELTVFISAQLYLLNDIHTEMRNMCTLSQFTPSSHLDDHVSEVVSHAGNTKVQILYV